MLCNDAWQSVPLMKSGVDFRPVNVCIVCLSWSVCDLCLSFITLTGEGITNDSLWRSNDYTTRFQMIPGAPDKTSTRGERTQNREQTVNIRTEAPEAARTQAQNTCSKVCEVFFFLYSVRRCPKRNSHTGCDIKRVLLEDQSPWNPLKMETRSSVLSRNWSLDLSDGGNSLYLHRVRTALENPWKQSYWKAFELLNDNICEISVSKKQSFHSKWTLQPVW